MAVQLSQPTQILVSLFAREQKWLVHDIVVLEHLEGRTKQLVADIAELLRQSQSYSEAEVGTIRSLSADLIQKIIVTIKEEAEVEVLIRRRQKIRDTVAARLDYSISNLKREILAEIKAVEIELARLVGVINMRTHLATLKPIIEKLQQDMAQIYVFEKDEFVLSKNIREAEVLEYAQQLKSLWKGAPPAQIAKEVAARVPPPVPAPTPPPELAEPVSFKVQLPSWISVTRGNIEYADAPSGVKTAIYSSWSSGFGISGIAPETRALFRGGDLIWKPYVDGQAVPIGDGYSMCIFNFGLHIGVDLRDPAGRRIDHEVQWAHLFAFPNNSKYAQMSGAQIRKILLEIYEAAAGQNLSNAIVIIHQQALDLMGGLSKSQPVQLFRFLALLRAM